MSVEHNKENIADGLLKSAPGALPASGLRKKDKSRSASMGPGAKTEVAQESRMTRRKSMMPAVKSILSGAKEDKTDEDEAARRKAARRKSLANRRVSFAPEATLHTWDVIEYMKDATSSSASSEEARRASSLSRATASSPTTKMDVDEENTRNNADAKTVQNTAHGNGNNDSTDDEDDTGDATMELDETVNSNFDDSSESTSSSSKLDHALRQATVAAQANIHNPSMAQENDDEDEDDQTMELAQDEVTSAFQSWLKRNQDGPVKRQSTMADQENVDPFRIVHDDHEQSTDEESNDDATMDVTVAVGGIIQQQLANESLAPATKPATRRRSNVSHVADSSGSPVSRPATRRSFGRRRSVAETTIHEDATMDLTMAVGGIKQVAETQAQNDATSTSLMDATMDFTMAVGGIKSALGKQDSGNVTEQLPNTEVLEDLSMELTGNLGQTIAEAINVIAPSPSTKASAQLIHVSPKPETLHFDRLLESTSSKETADGGASTMSSVKPSIKAESRVSATTPPSRQKLNATVELTDIHTPTRPQAGEALASKSSIADGLRMLATPRKEILPTPNAVHTSQITPRQASQKKSSPPRKRPADPVAQASPKKRVRMEGAEPTVTKIDSADAEIDLESDPISLPDFLGMTGIKFMDLTTTKRRATGFPGADAMMLRDTNDTIEELEPSMENKVAAAVATQPMLQMYQHSCAEMKSYIASGRAEIKNIEASAIESRPPLFYDYANASFAEKAIMDNQLRDLKTNARLQSKSSWHTWRSQLLNDLKKGLLHTAEELQQDGKLLGPIEALFMETVPAIVQQEEELHNRLRSLQQRKADVDNGVEADLQRAREQLQAIQSETIQRQALLESMRAEAREVQTQLEDARSWRLETLGATKEADRVSEECRGWSSTEVFALYNEVETLQSQLGWKVCSADANSVTLSSKDLTVEFDPRSWLMKSNAPQMDSAHTSISISCSSTSDNDGNAPLATIRRFFLQYIRAQAYSLPQSCTRISHFLKLLQNGWNLADRILSAVQGLEIGGRTTVQILNDDTLGIQALVFLPMLQTKVRIDFEIGVSTNAEDAHISGNVDVTAQVVYGERYDEPKMASFLQQFVPGGQVGSEAEVLKWAHGVDDLKDRLIRTGRKGLRRV